MRCEVALGPGIAMAPAYGSNHSVSRWEANTDWLRRTDLQREVVRGCKFERAIGAVADERPRFSRSNHDPGNRPAVLDQTDVHRELSVPLKELLGPVEGIDQEETVSRRWNMALCHGFLGNHGDPGHEPGEA